MPEWSACLRFGAIALLTACSSNTGEISGTGGAFGAGDVPAGTGSGPASSAGGRSPVGNSGGSGDAPPIVIHLPDAGRSMGSADAGCAGLTVAGETIPLDMLLLFDRSKSMLCEIPAGGDRWAATKTALTSFLQNQAAEGINVALTYFGAAPPGGDPGTSSCNPYDYQNPDVEFTALPAGATAIVNSLGAHTAQTDTPTVAALTGAINHAASWKADHLGHTVIVVLVTDGQPNACGSGSVTDVVDVAAQGLMRAKVSTYMIGILSPGNTCTLDTNQPNQSDLDKVAMAGGTDKALVVDTTKDTGLQLVETFNKIRQNAQIPCEYSIPKSTTDEKLDYGKVNVEYSDPMGGKHVVYYAETASKCDPAKGDGWYYDALPPTPAPTKILLCPSTCTTVTAKFGFRIGIKLGCEALRIPA